MIEEEGKAKEKSLLVHQFRCSQRTSHRTLLSTHTHRAGCTRAHRALVATDSKATRMAYSSGQLEHPSIASPAVLGTHQVDVHSDCLIMDISTPLCTREIRYHATAFLHCFCP
jgi:hypothetical protein